MRVDLVGFAPDLDAATPGILTDCDAIIPSTQGLSAASGLVDSGYPVLATAPSSAFVTELLDGSKRTLVGSATKIYEAVAGAWIDRSRAGDYTGANRQRYAVFGNITLATNRTQAIGAAPVGAGFADIAGAPAALIVVPASGFVVALNINGMGQGDIPDGWGCSGIRDHTVWTPSVSTQCAAGRLLDSPGAIRAGAALGGDVVAYKNTSMYVGRYIGPPIIWAWDRVPGDIGCSGAESLVVVGTQHFFIGPSDFYVFDGVVPRPIGGGTFGASATPVREWFFANLNAQYQDRIIGVADTARDLVYWYFPSQASNDGSLDSCLIYNYRQDRWGKRAISVQTAVQYSSGQITYDGLGALYSTYDDLPNISYDSPFWLADATIPGVLQGGLLYSLTGVPGASWMMTGDWGDLTNYSYLSRVTPRYRINPDSALGTNYYRDDLGSNAIQDETNAMSRGRFDFHRDSRWHRLRIDLTGTCLINGLDVDIKPGEPE